MVLIALATRSLYQPITSWQDALSYGLEHAVLYRLLYELIACRFSPWRIALLWLGSPLLLFSATWLRPVWAVVFTSCWAAALWWSIHQSSLDEKKEHPKRKSNDVAGYLIVLAWVSVCGAGGYGYQSSDYVMHNGRLLDLIHYSWPVSYTRPDGSQQMLVQYAGYYLWPALAGKLAGTSVAMFVQHLWLLVGCWLALRIATLLTQVRAWVAAIGLLLFGGWDFFGLLLFTVQRHFSELRQLDGQWLLTLLNQPGIPEWLDFWPAEVMSNGIWFGNFISLASSLLWSPHQVVAGWIVMGLLYQACRLQRVAAYLFSCALLMYWSPMIALGLLPMVLILVVWQWRNCRWNPSCILSILAGVMVLAVLGVYYTSVPVSDIPHGILPLLQIDPLVFILFFLQSWGLYAVLVALHRRWLDQNTKTFAVALFVAAVPVSFVYYGDYNDLMVRASAALFYGILLVMLTILRALWVARARCRVVLLVILLVPSTFSGVLNIWQAASHADVRVVGVRVVDYEWNWNFLGRQDSWFVRYLAK